MSKVNFNKWQKWAMVAIVLAVALNPLTVAVLRDYFDLAYTVISVVAAAYVVVFLLVSVFKTAPVTVPKKTAKRKLDGMAYEL